MQLHLAFGTVRVLCYRDPLDRWAVRPEVGSCDAGAVRWWGLQIGRGFILVEWSEPVVGSPVV